MFLRLILPYFVSLCNDRFSHRRFLTRLNGPACRFRQRNRRVSLYLVCLTVKRPTISCVHLAICTKNISAFWQPISYILAFPSCIGTRCSVLCQWTTYSVSLREYVQIQLGGVFHEDRQEKRSRGGLRHHQDHHRHHQGQRVRGGGGSDDAHADPAHRGVRGAAVPEDEPRPHRGGDPGHGGALHHGPRRV